jgi:hypothetical protein
MRNIVFTLGLGLALGCTNSSQITSVGETGGRGGSGGKGGRDGGSGFMVPDANFMGPASGGAGGSASRPDAGPYQGGITRPCQNLECRQASCLLGDCKQKACAAGARTTLRGRVYDPAGKVPLYNVVVYVPNAPLDPIATGPSCERCDSPVSGKPITTALTDTKGDFVLDNVPVGADVPLVIQVGKWRRTITLPNIPACTETHIDDPNLLRLPRNQKEGNLPRIALTTGGADRLECLLRKIGIDESEFTPESAAGRVNFYGGKGAPGTVSTVGYAPTLNGGAAFTPAITFWEQPGSFDKYDIVILSCEGAQFPLDKSPAALQALQTYANKGGRVFASHWHNVWLQNGPAPWPNVATWLRRGTELPDPFTSDIDTSFPKGEAMADWLVNVQASTTKGQLPIQEGKHTVESVDPMLSRQWLHSATPLGVQYFTFNTPAGAAAGMECGRLVFTDIHVSAQDVAGRPYPSGCVSTDLLPQEKALEFMLFDLSSCIQPDATPPAPPIP